MIYPVSVALSVVPAQAGTQSRKVEAAAPCSSQGQALGPRFRGDDEKRESYSIDTSR